MQLRGLRERCKLPQWGLGRSPSRQTISCILESKSTALVAAVFVDFPKNKCNFLHKINLAIVRRVQFLIWRRPMRSFFLLGQSPPLPYGSRRLCVQPHAAAAPAVQQSIDVSYPPGPQQQTRHMLLQRANGMDGHRTVT